MHLLVFWVFLLVAHGERVFSNASLKRSILTAVMNRYPAMGSPCLQPILTIDFQNLIFRSGTPNERAKPQSEIERQTRHRVTPLPPRMKPSQIQRIKNPTLLPTRNIILSQINPINIMLVKCLYLEINIFKDNQVLRETLVICHVYDLFS